MSDEWLDTSEAAERLGCPSELVAFMAREEVLTGRKEGRRWRVKAVEVERMQSLKSPAPTPSPSLPKKEVDPGMVEVSIALAGIGVAIATFLPTRSLPANLTRIVAIVTGVTAVSSSYGALWLLARYRYPEKASPLGFEILAFFINPIWVLLTSPTRFISHIRRIGPYWFVGLGLIAWLALSILIGGLAM